MEQGGELGSAIGREEAQKRSFAVAVLLAVAAAAAALIGGRAALLGDAGSDQLNHALREDVRQGARIVDDARRLYQQDVAVAHRIAEARLLADEISAAAREEEGLVRDMLEAEAEARAFVAELLAGEATLGESPRAATRLEGADLLARFAEIRAERSTDLAALDPDATEEDAEEQLRASSLLTAATIVVALAFLLGALAEAFPRSRRILMLSGYACVTVGAIAAVVIEVSI